MTVPANMIWGNQGPKSGVVIGSGGIIGMPRADGFNDGLNIVQGVRVFDGTVNGWSTPDAYQGDVRDPMSQKSYVWNGDNPVSYSDPSGYYLLEYDSLATSWRSSDIVVTGELPDDGQILEYQEVPPEDEGREDARDDAKTDYASEFSAKLNNPIQTLLDRKLISDPAARNKYDESIEKANNLLDELSPKTIEGAIKEAAGSTDSHGHDVKATKQ